MPQTTSEKLEYLNNTKSLIKNAIINKGQEVTSSTPFREYVDKINNIETDYTQTEEYQQCLAITQDILDIN